MTIFEKTYIVIALLGLNLQLVAVCQQFIPENSTCQPVAIVQSKQN